MTVRAHCTRMVVILAAITLFLLIGQIPAPLSPPLPEGFVYNPQTVPDVLKALIWGGAGALVVIVPACIWIVQLRRVAGKRTAELEREILLRRDREEMLRRSEEKLHEKYEELLAIEEMLRRQIREYEQSQTQLSASNKRFETLIDTSPVAILSIDGEHRITVWNRMAETVFGWSAGEALGRPLDQIFQSADLAAAVRQAWTSQIVFSVTEQRLRARDGREIIITLTANRLPDAHGTPSGIVAAVEDVSRRLELEEQLRQSQKMDALGQLAGGIAHDFNNMLTAIIGFASVIENRASGALPDIGRDAGLIIKSAERAAQLTRGLLVFSRKQPTRFRPVNMVELVHELKKLLDRLLTEDITLRVTTAARPVCVHADAGQMEQVLINLVTNARDAMGGKGVVGVEVGTVRQGEEFVLGAGDFACLKLSDTGSGIDESIQHRIFEPFFTTKPLGKGTGLGLSIVFGIVRKHGGCIDISSTAGRGTTFSIYLPLLPVPADAEQVAEAAGYGSGTGTVLLAEDDLIVRESLGGLLEAMGYRVIHAADGEAAVAAYGERHEEIGMVLMDVRMPRKNGLEACREIRRADPAARVLLMSGHSDESIGVELPFGEGLDFVAKPVAPGALLEKLRAMLR